MVTFSMNGGNGGNGALSVRCLINNRSLSKTRRALLGSAVLKGEYDLKPTAKDVARMVGCSVGYLNAAAKLSPAEQQRVVAGLRPLIEPKVKSSPMPVSPPVPIVPPITLGTERLLAAIVDKLGIAGVRDLLAGLERAAGNGHAAP